MLPTLQNYFLYLGSKNYEWNKVGEGQYCSSGNYEKYYYGFSFEQCQSHCEEAVQCKQILWNADSSECTLLDCKEWGTSSFRPTQETWEINRNKMTIGSCF